jgi:hypothetical protein
MREKGGVNMQTRQEIFRMFVLLYFVGIALLVLGFFLLISPEWRTHSAWLDLTILLIVYSINFPLLSIWHIGVASFSAKIPALGLLGLCDLFYSCMALGLMFWGVAHDLPFRLQLIGQMGLLFLAMTAAAIAWLSSAHAEDVNEEEQATQCGLEALKAAISQCETELSARAPNRNREHQLLLKLKEDTRYLSPSGDPSAISAERQMITLVDDIRLRLEDAVTPLTPSPLEDQFEQCAALMALRKQTFDR